MRGRPHGVPAQSRGTSRGTQTNDEWTASSCDSSEPCPPEVERRGTLGRGGTGPTHPPTPAVYTRPPLPPVNDKMPQKRKKSTGILWNPSNMGAWHRFPQRRPLFSTASTCLMAEIPRPRANRTGPTSTAQAEFIPADRNQRHEGGSNDDRCPVQRTGTNRRIGQFPRMRTSTRRLSFFDPFGLDLP